MEYIIVPAIIAENKGLLIKRINAVKGEAKRIQIDIMDGEFVPRQSNWFDFILPGFKGLYEAHLMVHDPISWLESKNFAQFDSIVIHAESLSHELLAIALKLVREKKKEFVLAFSPETPWENYLDFLHIVDGVLIMAVHPGNYSAQFIPRTIDKIRHIRKNFPSLNIEVDGAMHEHHIAVAKKAGANIFCVGGRIYKSESPLKALWELEKIIKTAPVR